MRDDKPDLSQWQPRELIVDAKTLPLPDFLLSCEAAFMFVVTVDANDQELALGLSASTPGRGGDDGLAFRTATRDLSATISGDVVPARASLARPSLPFSEQTSERLPSSLKHKCHVVPIRKRSEVSFLHHVSVGRARNHDIVLRHKSVSKFHAWFEITQDVRLFVKDCDSSNHTFVNGKQVKDREEVRPGDTLRFGSVEGRICTSEGLWRLMRSS
jgi:hypothetical protein